VIKISDLMNAHNLFDFKELFARDIFTGLKYPWEVIPLIKDYIPKLVSTLPDDFEEIDEWVWVGKGTVIEDTARIKGPAVIGYDCEIRHAAYLRENVILGNQVVVGNSSELKNSILFNEVEVPHFNYVGDSVLGYKSHLGAGVILSNLKSSKDSIIIKDLDGSHYETGMRKLGALIGDKVEVGCNAVLNPGTVIGPETIIYPLTSVRGTIPGRSVVKGDGSIIPRK
jgi:NDP-sugar pyrophosphorylase family protein